MTVLILIPCIFLFMANKQVRRNVGLSRERLCIPSGTSQERVRILLLICGEDHRFYNHIGWDPIAILRAIFRYYRHGKLEGASTIEQQYVRTCSARYKISLTRKIEEIAASTILSIMTRKDTIAYSYLVHAYYGASISSLDGAVVRLKEIYECDFTERELAPGIVALFKTPIPQNPTSLWKIKHQQRWLYIKKRYEQLQSIYPELDQELYRIRGLRTIFSSKL